MVSRHVKDSSAASGQLRDLLCTWTCSGACPITLQTISTSLPIPGSAVTTASWTTFVPAATHQAIVLNLTYDGTVGSHASSCTDNSVSMTQVYTPIVGTGATLFGTSYFIIPSTGNNAIVCTFTSGADVVGVAELYAGVNQTGTVGNSWRSPFTAVDGGSNSKIASVTVTNTTAASDVLVDFAVFDTVGTVTAITSNNNQIFVAIDPSGSSIQVSMQWAQGTGSNVTMTETQATTSTTPTWAIGAFALVAG